MLITGMFHAAIRTSNLEATTAFYTGVLGLREVPRPAAIPFPGAWYAVPTPVGEAVIHVYAGDAAGPEGRAPDDNDAGIIDHLAMTANGYLAFRERFATAGLDWREQNNPPSPVWQLYVHDPNGLKIELTFHQSGETGLPVEIPQDRRYRASERFFDPAPYRALA